MQREPVDILLLDHKLLHMTGLDVLRRLMEVHADVIPIMMTAYASIETAVSATKLGAYDFLCKPFTPDELKAVVYRAAKVRLLQRQARTLAQEKRRVRFELLSIVSHELKSPLAAIETYLNIMKDRSAGDNPKAYDDMIERCIVRARGMRKLILDLLDSARIESGQKRRRLEPVDLSGLLEAAVDLVRPEAQQQRIIFKLAVPPSIRMTADADEMEMIFSNLVSNAVKYNHPGGAVDVALSAGEKGIELRVADTGIGMTEAEAATLFREFSRVKNRQTQDIAGSGLGLSIVRKIVDLYSGAIAVKSTSGAGSTFTVTFPPASL